MANVASICDEIAKNYSPCDVSDALLVLRVPGAGYLVDIHPIPSRLQGSSKLVAPISTVVFVPNSHIPGAECPTLPSRIPRYSNISSAPDIHWTDAAPPGSAVLMQQPADTTVAVVGDIVATRYLIRGVRGVIVDGRSRDSPGIGKLCEAGKFQAWTKKLSSVGTSLEAKPWAIDIPIVVGGIKVSPGDILVADEAEQVCTVIPRDKLEEVAAWLPKLKQADDAVLRDAQAGLHLKKSFATHTDHYTNQH